MFVLYCFYLTCRNMIGSCGVPWGRPTSSSGRLLADDDDDDTVCWSIYTSPLSSSFHPNDVHCWTYISPIYTYHSVNLKGNFQSNYNLKLLYIKLFSFILRTHFRLLTIRVLSIHQGDLKDTCSNVTTTRIAYQTWTTSSWNVSFYFIPLFIILTYQIHF